MVSKRSTAKLRKVRGGDGDRRLAWLVTAVRAHLPDRQMQVAIMQPADDQAELMMISQVVAVVIAAFGQHHRVARSLQYSRDMLRGLFGGIEGFVIDDMKRQSTHRGLGLFGILTANHGNAVIGGTERNQGIARVDVLAIKRGPSLFARVATVRTLGHGLRILLSHGGTALNRSELVVSLTHRDHEVNGHLPLINGHGRVEDSALQPGQHLNGHLSSFLLRAQSIYLGLILHLLDAELGSQLVVFDLRFDRCLAHGKDAVVDDGDFSPFLLEQLFRCFGPLLLFLQGLFCRGGFLFVSEGGIAIGDQGENGAQDRERPDAPGTDVSSFGLGRDEDDLCGTDTGGEGKPEVELTAELALVKNTWSVRSPLRAIADRGRFVGDSQEGPLKDQRDGNDGKAGDDLLGLLSEPQNQEDLADGSNHQDDGSYPCPDLAVPFHQLGGKGPAELDAGNALVNMLDQLLRCVVHQVKQLALHAWSGWTVASDERAGSWSWWLRWCWRIRRWGDVPGLASPKGVAESHICFSPQNRCQKVLWHRRFTRLIWGEYSCKKASFRQGKRPRDTQTLATVFCLKSCSLFHSKWAACQAVADAPGRAVLRAACTCWGWLPLFFCRRASRAVWNFCTCLSRSACRAAAAATLARARMQVRPILP